MTRMAPPADSRRARAAHCGADPGLRPHSGERLRRPRGRSVRASNGLGLVRAGARADAGRRRGRARRTPAAPSRRPPAIPRGGTARAAAPVRTHERAAAADVIGRVLRPVGAARRSAGSGRFHEARCSPMAAKCATGTGVARASPCGSAAASGSARAWRCLGAARLAAGYLPIVQTSTSTCARNALPAGGIRRAPARRHDRRVRPRHRRRRSRRQRRGEPSRALGSAPGVEGGADRPRRVRARAGSGRPLLGRSASRKARRSPFPRRAS